MNKNRIYITLLSLSFVFQFVHAQVLDPVDWKFESRKITWKEIDLFFKAEIDDKWHLYSQDIPKGGPIATSFTFTPSEHYRLSGKTVEVSWPEVKHDPSFNMDLKMFSKEAIFKQRIVLLTGQDFILEGSIEYMTCDDSRCLPPTDEAFSFEIKAPTGGLQNAPPESPLKTAEKKLELEAAGKSDTQLHVNDSTVSEADNTAITESKEQGSISSGSDAISQDAGDNGEKRSIWVFFLISFMAGLAALLTPCVFPMIPMTVTFFMREGRKRIKAIMIGLIFGLSIILIYTSIGFIVSLTSAGADIANVVSTHWIPNLIFFILFVVFAASFLGMFELVLPGKWVNTSDRQADKGGYIGAFFMAFTLVLVSFSCTGPIVGALLVESAGGLALKPIIGMFGFSLAFSLPFTLLSIFPSWLSSLPKSGGWLNSIKVVLGFIVLAFSFKFLSTIDQSYHLGLLGRELYLAIWIVIFIMVGFYLLGKLKFAHDSDLEHISVPRLFLSISAFAFAVYLVSGLFGAPLKGISSLLPPVTESPVIVHSGQISSGTNESSTGIISAGNCGPARYSDFLHLPYDLQGYFDYEEGMACAKQQNKPVLLDFKGHACSTCKVMEAKVWSDSRVLKHLREDFIIIALYVDDKTKLPENEWLTSDSDKTMKKTIGKKNLDFQISKFNTNTLPYYVIIDNNGDPLTNAIGFEPDPAKYLEFLKEGLNHFIP
jgi:thiol:disulfide interchange protein DsbD